MGGGGQQREEGKTDSGKAGGVYTWEDVQSHCTKTDQWVVINRKVYNVTQWAKRHPGGFRVLYHYAGEDATEPFSAFHPDQKFVQKYMKALQIGELAATEPSQDRNKNAAVMKDFQDLYVKAESQGMFRTRPLFFILHLGHIILLEVLALLMVRYFGTNWIVTLLCAVMLATAQSQAGWLQHDFGHLSVFKKSYWNHVVHKFVIGHIKGASANWWNHRHFQHHAKPNVVLKDPDINMLNLFVLGDSQPVEYGIKKIKNMPYNHQHKYFFLVGPPLLIPIFFHLQIIQTMISRRYWVDLVWFMSFYIRYFYCYVPLYGVIGATALLFFVRFMESHWFVWVTQMNHIPMEIDYEKHQDWLTMQLQSTCNVEQSFFNDWFSGHLNFQIEHHLFPRMPRHNYYLVAPHVEALCKKHGIPYQTKTLWQAFSDIVTSLKSSGDLWLDAYLNK
ncbi:fatty acid desaturase 2 [Anabas testudineus]|uniref:Cytochrome b5 heme-binding domain-containing protein n=1 Tax=Anabas testudineus TaxID=64144 RepID=A0A3Q1I6N4_ANATE|nr:fatty acid desaturase 2 [Anabas testudineus]